MAQNLGSSGQNLFHEVSIDIGESVIAAEVTPGEFFVIEAELMQDRGVQIMQMDFAGDRAEAEVVGLAEGEAGFDAATGEPGAKALGLMLAAVFFDGRGAAEVLAPRRAAKLAAPDDERVFEQPS